jgi:toxin CcdB
MTQFCVHRNADVKGRAEFPLLLDVQSELLAGLNTRVVVPLSPAASARSRTLTTLTPVLEIDGKRYLMMTPQIAGVSARLLGAQVAKLASRRGDIIAALDLLITGI